MIYEYNAYDKYVIEQLTGSLELPLLDFKHDRGYLVNHKLKVISKGTVALNKLIKEEFRYCFNKDKCTKLLLIILAKDTESIDYDIEEYTHISQYESLDKEIPKKIKIDERVEKVEDKKCKQSIVMHYQTEEDFNDVYNTYGCYAIYNETLKIIYVGETTRTFHIRWNNHYYNKKQYTKKRQQFLCHPDTYFIILYVSNGDKEETEEIEAQCIEYYKQEYPDWVVLGGTYDNNQWTNYGIHIE